MDSETFASFLGELSSSSLSSYQKLDVFVRKVKEEKKISSEQLGKCLKYILFVNFRLRCCEESATYITDWEKHKGDLKGLVKKWEFDDFEEAIEEKRRDEKKGGGLSEAAKMNRTLQALIREKKEAGSDDDETLQAAVEDKKEMEINVNVSVKETADDSPWTQPTKENEAARSKKTPEMKRVSMIYTHFDKKKNAPLVDLILERDVPTFREDCTTIAYGEDFAGDLILDVKNDFKIKNGIPVSLVCNEVGKWVTGSGKDSRTHYRDRKSYSKQLILLSFEDRNRTFYKGERVIIPFKFDEIIDAPSFCYGGHRDSCSVTWQFQVYIDLDYGSTLGNAFGRNINFTLNLVHVGKYLSISANPHLGTPTEREISVIVPTFMCYCGTGELEGRVWLERDHFSVADDVWRNRALRSVLQMQLKNGSKKDIENARYEFHRSISIDGHCLEDRIVSSGHLPRSCLKPEMMNFENFNFQLSVADQAGLSYANQATSPEENFAKIEWSLAIIFKVKYAFDPKIVFPITLVSGFVA
jgi:hypothetical protein